MASPEVIIVNGQERMLARLVPEASHLKMRAGMQSFSQYLDINKLKLIPRSLWKPVKNRLIFPSSFCNNQLRYGACVFASAVMAVDKSRVLRGQPHKPLSWAWGYDQINGGRDQGACITDSMTVLLNEGCPPYEDYDPVPQFNRNKQPESRKRFKLQQGLTLTNFDEMGTAVQMGFMIQYPVQVGRKYNNLDGDYVCGVDQGPGNHSVHSDGMDFLSSLNEWVFDHMGSWDTTWGNQGRGWHREAHIMGCAVEDDAYTHMDPIEDPKDSEDLPDLK